MTVTIKDIAKVAGVSYSTVSRALHGNPMIPPDTTMKIRTIAEELGYVPNSVARGLRMTQSGVIGILVRRIDDPFLAEVLQGAEDVLSGEGYSLFVATSRRDAERETLIFRTMSERRVDGVIICSSNVGQRHLQSLSAFGVPTVIITNQSNDDIAHSIYHDDVSGGFAVTQHLIELGHQRIAYLGNERTGRITQERLHGYKAALSQAEITVNPSYIVAAPNGTSEGGAATVAQLMANTIPPTAIVCFNDLMAIGAMFTLREQGLQIPVDCSITGFDNIQLSQYIIPPLTTFHQPRYELGSEAAAMMLRLLNRKTSNFSTTEVVTLKGDLVVRQSTSSPTVDKG